MNIARPSERTQLRRKPGRGRYDRQTIHAIIDESPICHVGIVDDARPLVIPTLHGRVSDTLYLHGSRSSRLLALLGDGRKTCITFAIVDGLVLARTAMQHSMNYRSVVMFGHGRPVDDVAEKREALRAIVDHALPGRIDELPDLAQHDIAATAVVAIAIDDASAKIRSGGAGETDVVPGSVEWAGIVPLATVPLPPIPEPDLTPNVGLPASVQSLRSAGRYRAGAL